MLMRRPFLSTLSMTLTVAFSVPAFALFNQDTYPNRENLLAGTKNLCKEVQDKKTILADEYSFLLKKYFSFADGVSEISQDSSGWSADYILAGKPGGFLRLFKNGNYLSFSYRQSRSQIESIANISLDQSCNLIEARYTFYNSALRPIYRIKVDSWQMITQSVVIEEPVQDGSPVSANAIRIGIIDSGIDYNHPALIGKSRPMLGIDLTDQARPPYDYTNSIQNELMGRHFTHGSAVADIASRNVNALIVPVRIANESVYAAEAVEYLAQKNVRLINISQGGYREHEWRPLEKAMRNHPEILFIVAAGNESENIDDNPSYPSSLSLPNMIVVTSVDQNGQLSSFSNYGPQHVHFAALGENVSAAHAGGGQWTVNGSSFAAPLVTNIAAKMLKENPKLSITELRSLLIQKAQPTRSLKDKIQYGILSANSLH
ncbi:MAG: hypothetical protein BroJett040_03660 [Oligoflexia bacterium]|nr:MAG: hypothetical protein BroJett040_03660 [Oligoflexia bacterium]